MIKNVISLQCVELFIYLTYERGWLKNQKKNITYVAIQKSILATGYKRTDKQVYSVMPFLV